MSFLKELKIAVVNKDLEKLEKLSLAEPSFSSIDEAKEILKYIQEAKNILQEEKSKLSSNMQEIKKLQKFYSSKKSTRFDFKI